MHFLRKGKGKEKRNVGLRVKRNCAKEKKKYHVRIVTSFLGLLRYRRGESPRKRKVLKKLAKATVLTLSPGSRREEGK